MLTALLLLAAAAPAAPPQIVVTAIRRPLPAMPVADVELARMRAGLRLPNGLDVSIGIDIQTRIDGVLALHTVYASEGATPGIRVFTDGLKPVPLAPTTQSIATPAVQSIPLLVVDRSPTGTTIVPVQAVKEATVNLVDGDPATWLSGEGQIQVPVARNGPAVPTPNGEVSFVSDDDGAVIRLVSPTLEVRQLVGQATGVIVANTANNRSIDTVSSVNVDLQGLTPGLLTGIFAAQRMVSDAITLGR